MILRTATRKPYYYYCYNYYPNLVKSGRRSFFRLNSSADNPSFLFLPSRSFSSDDRRPKGDDDHHAKAQSPFDTWDLSSSDTSDPFTFGEEPGGGGGEVAKEEEAWVGGVKEEEGEEEDGGVFKNIEKEVLVGEEWDVAQGYEQWTLGGEDDDGGKKEGEGGELFDMGDVGSFHGGGEVVEDDKVEEDREKLLFEEHDLKNILKGQKHAFGDLIAASGITNAMLDNLIALKDFKGVEGLPPLSVIEDMRYEKNTRKTSRAEVERQKQEEIAKARVRQVDDRGRAYATGRRKCSIARVWVQPGTGLFVVNDKQFDLYFPDLGHRATLLRPFSETDTLGSWDVDCTVKGGGVSGQVGAVRLGISRALQNLNPEFRPSLKAAGFLKRDPRIVERKKPGKAKARKSFQWVKR